MRQNNKTEIQFRTATIEEAEAMATVDALSWPAELAVSAETVRQRILAYPEGQQVATVDGAMAGVSSAQRISAAFLSANSATYDSITDANRFTASHRSDGEIYQLIGVGVNPAFRGLNLGRLLVNRQIAFARSLPGVQRVVGFTRPANYSQHSELPIDEYLKLRKPNGRVVDPVVAFHVSAGAHVVSVHFDFRPTDRASCGYGVLIEYA